MGWDEVIPLNFIPPQAISKSVYLFSNTKNWLVLKMKLFKSIIGFFVKLYFKLIE